MYARYFYLCLALLWATSGSSQTLWGVLSTGGEQRNGAIQQIANNTQSIAFSFPAYTQAHTPVILSADKEGMLYGICIGGGTSGRGMVFRLNPDNGQLTNAKDFSAAENPRRGAGLAPTPEGEMLGYVQDRAFSVGRADPLPDAWPQHETKAIVAGKNRWIIYTGSYDAKDPVSITWNGRRTLPYSVVGYSMGPQDKAFGISRSDSIIGVGRDTEPKLLGPAGDPGLNAYAIAPLVATRTHVYGIYTIGRQQGEKWQRGWSIHKLNLETKKAETVYTQWDDKLNINWEISDMVIDRYGVLYATVYDTQGRKRLLRFDTRTDVLLQDIDLAKALKLPSALGYVFYECIQGGALVASADGKIYGLAGQHVFRYDPASGELRSIYAFTPPPMGAEPIGGMVQDRDGWLYGRTLWGGEYGYGVLFGYHPTQKRYEVKASLTAAGHTPVDLHLANDGGIYFALETFGGAYGNRLASPGPVVLCRYRDDVLQSLQHITSDQGQLISPLLGSDAQGNIYGSALLSWPQSGGSIFRYQSQQEQFSLVEGLRSPVGNPMVSPDGKVYYITYGESSMELKYWHPAQGLKTVMPLPVYSYRGQFGKNNQLLLHGDGGMSIHTVNLQKATYTKLYDIPRTHMSSFLDSEGLNSVSDDDQGNLYAVVRAADEGQTGGYLYGFSPGQQPALLAGDIYVSAPATEMHPVLPVKNQASIRQDLQVRICRGQDYTFPDGVTYYQIQQPLQRDIRHVGRGSAPDTLLRVKVDMSMPLRKELWMPKGSSYTFPDGSKLGSLQGDTLQTSHLTDLLGCDSTIVTQLRMAVPSHAQVHVAHCGGPYRFPDGSSIADLQADTVQTSRLKGMGDSDSTIVTHVQYHPPKARIQASLCWGSRYSFPDGSSAFIFQDTLQVSKEGPDCGQTTLTYITCNRPPLPTEESIKRCIGETHTFPDGSTAVMRDASIVHVSRLLTPTGCEYTITTTLLPLRPYRKERKARACAGMPYTFPDGSTAVLKADTVQYSRLLTRDGCDSLIVSEVRIGIPPTRIKQQVCIGTRLKLPSGRVTAHLWQDHTTVDTLRSSLGCDSLLIVEAEVRYISPNLRVAGSGIYRIANRNEKVSWMQMVNEQAIPIPNASNTEYYRANRNGRYTASIQSGSCTTLADTVNVDISMVTGLDAPQENILFGPNPSKGDAQIILPQAVAWARVKIYDVSGRLLAEHSYQDAQRLSLSLPFPSGCYFCHLELPGQPGRTISLLKE